MQPLGSRGGKLLKKGGKLVRGCNCCDGGVDCLPGEQALDCPEQGKTGIGPDPGVVYQLDPTRRGVIEVKFTVQQGQAELKAVTANVGTSIRILQPGQTLTALICKPIGAPDISIGIDDFGTNAAWEYTMACLKKCCDLPPVRTTQPNPLP